MEKSDVLDLFDGNKLLASKELRVARQSIYTWPDAGELPEYVQMKVRDYLLRTNGKVRRDWMPK